MRGHVRLWLELLALSWRRQRLMCAAVVGAQALSVAAFAANALAVRETVDAAVRGSTRHAVLYAVAAACAFAASLVLAGLSAIWRVQIVERIGITELEPAIVRMVTGVDGIEHLERTDFLDRVTVLRGSAWGIAHSAWGTVDVLFSVARLTVALVLLGSVHPLLLLLLVFAFVPLLLDERASAGMRDVEVRTAEDLRLQRHLFELATSPSAGAEIRVAGVAEQLVARQGEAWERACRLRFEQRLRVTPWRFGGWLIFTLGFGAGLALIVSQVAAGHSGVGEVVMTVMVAISLRSMVAATVSRASMLVEHRRLLHHLEWMRAYVRDRRAAPAAGRPAPATLRRGIVLDGLSYTYPGTGRPAVEDLSVSIAAGTVVAVVGQYGSGKTTLVKLLCKLYEPSQGTVMVDGIDLCDIDTAAWRRRISAAFQDFGRYQTTFGDAVGLGDIDRRDDPTAIAGAVRAADADALVAALPDGLETQLGADFGGVDLSTGQWQKTAVARALMRESPLLFILDEPTASLDAPSEQAIFSSYLRHARTLATTVGAVTVLVSHRFSTVADADLILVMDGGRIVESGSHHELLAADGAYASLNALHTSSYADVKL
jgi:ATP-binding cassette subfamily B protein